MDQIKKLEELFAARIESYSEHTSKIKDLINDGLKAIETYILDDIMQPTAQVIWGAISPIRSEGINVTAMVTFPVGTKINTADGSDMFVSEANARYFNFILQMGIPRELVFETKEAILKYLREHEQDEHRDIKKQIQQLFGVPDSDAEFDMDSLTEEQQKALLSWESDSEQNSRH